ncbi:MAG: hypothetical protein MR014_05705, partial [Oscillospiraceae bacterium]|nr:hypothetical protein [Oscillospiraceae bacterium]
YHPFIGLSRTFFRSSSLSFQFPPPRGTASLYYHISPPPVKPFLHLFENSFSLCPGYTIYNIHAVKRGAFMPSPVAILKTAIVAALNILFLLLCRLLYGM